MADKIYGAVRVADKDTEFAQKWTLSRDIEDILLPAEYFIAGEDTAALQQTFERHFKDERPGMTRLYRCDPYANTFAIVMHEPIYRLARAYGDYVDEAIAHLEEYLRGEEQILVCCKPQIFYDSPKYEGSRLVISRAKVPVPGRKYEYADDLEWCSVRLDTEAAAARAKKSEKRRLRDEVASRKDREAGQVALLYRQFRAEVIEAAHSACVSKLKLPAAVIKNDYYYRVSTAIWIRLHQRLHGKAAYTKIPAYREMMPLAGEFQPREKKNENDREVAEWLREELKTWKPPRKPRPKKPKPAAADDKAGG